MTLSQADRLAATFNRLGARRMFVAYVNLRSWNAPGYALYFHNLSRTDAGRFHSVDVVNSTPARAVAHFRGFLSACPERT